MGLVVLWLARPLRGLPAALASPATGPVPPGRGFLATGPYRIESCRPGHELVLVRNPQWDRVTRPARTQYPRGYDLRFAPMRRIERVLRTEARRTALTFDRVTGHVHGSGVRGFHLKRTFGLPTWKDLWLSRPH